MLSFQASTGVVVLFWYPFFNLYKIFNVHQFSLDFLFAGWHVAFSILYMENPIAFYHVVSFNLYMENPVSIYPTCSFRQFLHLSKHNASFLWRILPYNWLILYFAAFATLYIIYKKLSFAIRICWRRKQENVVHKEA